MFQGGPHLANVGKPTVQPTNGQPPGASRLESAGGLWSGATQVATRSIAQSGATDLSGGRNLPGGFFLPNNRVGEEVGK